MTTSTPSPTITPSNAGIAANTVMQNLQSAGYLAPGATKVTSTPVAPASTTTPTGSSTVRPYPTTTAPAPTGTNGVSPADTAAASYYNSPDAVAARAPVDQAKVRSDALAAIQGATDNINTTYAGLISTQNKNNANTEGQNRAAAARGGSLLDPAAVDKSVADNNDAAAKVKQLSDERDSKVNALIDQANTNATNMIKTDQATEDKSNTDYIKYLDQSKTDAMTNFKALIASGGKISDIPDATYKYYLDATGMTPEQLHAMEVTLKPQASVVHSEVIGGKYVQVSKDPVTGALTSTSIALPFTVPEKSTITKLDDGRLMFTPADGIDYSKPLDGQIKIYDPSDPNGGTTNNYKISAANSNKLAGYGFSNAEIQTLQGDIRKYGLPAVLARTDLPADRMKAIKAVFDTTTNANGGA